MEIEKDINLVGPDKKIGYNSEAVIKSSLSLKRAKV